MTKQLRVDDEQLRNCRNGKRLLKQQVADLEHRLTDMQNVCRTYDVELAEMHRARPLLDAVIAIWRHTEQHAEFVEGQGYITTPHIKPCHDPDEHSRLALEEGAAWREYRT